MENIKIIMTDCFKTAAALSLFILLAVQPGFGKTLKVPSQYPTIQAGLNASGDGDTVLVAGGTYKGPGNKDLDFNGKAVLLKSEQGALNTIIDCQKNGRGIYFDSMEDSMTIVQGFTIKNGYKNKYSNGGGICIGEGTSPLLLDLIISDNRADFEYGYGPIGKGGGIFCGNYTSPVIKRCTILRNIAEDGGGGIFCDEASQPRIIECSFEENEATPYHSGNGGGIQCLRCAAFISNCIFRRNIGRSADGIDLRGDRSVITHCLFTGARVKESGYEIFCSGSSAIISQCTMTGLYGSGIAFYGGNPVLENSIIWGNGGREIYIYDGSVAQVSYCDIGDGGFTGEGNISLNPRFCSPDFGDFSIHETSPCSGTGKGGVDMGAFSRGCEGGSPGNCLKVPSEYTGIKQALDAAYFYGDTVLVAPGTYRGLENTDLNTWGKSLVLKSEMGSGKTIIDCIPDEYGNHFGILITCNEDSSVVIQGFTIKNAEVHREGAGIGIWGSSPLIKDCIFDYNFSYCSGGGIYLSNSSSKIKNCIFSRNYALREGGGISIASSFNPEISDCRLEKNSSSYGGGIYLFNAFSPEISGCLINENSSSGGGICSYNSSPVIKNTDFFKNVGDGIYFYEGESALVEECIFFNQTYSAMYIYRTPMRMNHCTIAGNGSGVNLSFGSAEIMNSIIWGNANDELSASYGGFTVTYSNIGDGGISGQGNISEAPRFCAAGSYIFDLHDSSPCAFAGKGGVHMGARGIGCRGGSPGKIHRVPEDFGNIQEALKWCYFYGDTVIVSPGIYSGEGNKDIIVFEKQVVLRSEKGPDSTMILCRDQGEKLGRGFVVLSEIDTATCIEGFTIKNGYHVIGGGMILNDASPFIRDCIFECDTAVYDGGAIHCQGSPVIKGCRFYDNIAYLSGGGIQSYLESSPRVEQSLFVNNAALGVYGGAINSYSASGHFMITNCTITGNRARWQGGGINNIYSDARIINSIFWDNIPDQIKGYVPVTYSDIENGWSGEGNIAKDPMLVNPQQRDFRLLTDSPCIDSGNPNFVNVRWGGARRDMGAFEFDKGWYLDEKGRIIRKPLPRNKNLAYKKFDN